MRIYITRVDEKFEGEEIVTIDEINVLEHIRGLLPSLETGMVLKVFATEVSVEALEAFMEERDR